MSHNSFGHLFRVTTWGESHGPAIGCVIDGCPPGLPLTVERIQARLDQRRPGTSRFVTQRREPDKVQILSGVFEDDRSDGPRTTGTPISLMIENVDQRSKDYSSIRDRYRPGHADYTYEAKYGIRDYRGGGRSSARETASRVAAGAVAFTLLEAMCPQLTIEAALIGLGPHRIDPARTNWSTRHDNPFWCPDPVAAQEWEGVLDTIRKEGDSVGALIEVRASGVPVGLGAPIYGKMDADLAAALMSINAAKGVEIGAGFAMADGRGSDMVDTMHPGPDGPTFAPSGPDNINGGVLGGITTGQDLVARLAIKPTSSILKEVPSVTKDGDAVKVQTKGRHDPCVGIRGVPVAEAMMALVLADHLLRHRGQIGEGGL
ncbi:chorismate synthase [Parvularcula bermudensis]